MEDGLLLALQELVGSELLDILLSLVLCQTRLRIDADLLCDGFRRLASGIETLQVFLLREDLLVLGVLLEGFLPT